MGKVEGCWANVLDDCEGELTEEHLVSVAVWEPLDGKDNRDGKLAKEVTVRMGAGDPPTTKPIADLTAKVLCRRHNNSTHKLDEASGNFRRALSRYNLALNTRDKSRNWLAQRDTVHGPFVDRWFLKTAITNAVKFKQPIGSPDAAPGSPTRELVEMVYGVRPIQRPIGFAAVQWVNNTINYGKEEFSFVYYDRNGTHLAGCIVAFRTLTFAVKLETYDMPEHLFQRLFNQPEAAVLQPFRGLNSDVNAFVHINWPDEPLKQRR